MFYTVWLIIFIFLTLVLILLWFGTQNKLYGKVLLTIWCSVILLSVCGLITKKIFQKIKIDKKDYVGTCVIDRYYFTKKQSDWQYNNFRFEIKENDSIYFYQTNNIRIVKTYCGTVVASDADQNGSHTLILKMEKPSHHILSSNPTTYRSTWNFHLVFYSEKFNNVYFKKGKWKPI